MHGPMKVKKYIFISVVTRTKLVSLCSTLHHKYSHTLYTPQSETPPLAGSVPPSQTLHCCFSVFFFFFLVLYHLLCVAPVVAVGAVKKATVCGMAVLDTLILNVMTLTAVCPG